MALVDAFGCGGAMMTMASSLRGPGPIVLISEAVKTTHKGSKGMRRTVSGTARNGTGGGTTIPSRRASTFGRAPRAMTSSSGTVGGHRATAGHAGRTVGSTGRRRKTLAIGLLVVGLAGLFWVRGQWMRRAREEREAEEQRRRGGGAAGAAGAAGPAEAPEPARAVPEVRFDDDEWRGQDAFRRMGVPIDFAPLPI